MHNFYGMTGDSDVRYFVPVLACTNEDVARTFDLHAGEKYTPAPENGGHGQIFCSSQRLVEIVGAGGPNILTSLDNRLGFFPR
jgi:hypothetical protein